MDENNKINDKLKIMKFSLLPCDLRHMLFLFFFFLIPLFWLDGRGLWLNSLLLDVSLPSVCGIFRNGLSGSQMNSLSGETACYTAVHRPTPAAVGITGWFTSEKLLLLTSGLCLNLIVAEMGDTAI